MIKTFRPNDLQAMSEKELRKEYARLKRSANRRLENLERNALGTWGSNRFASSRNMSKDWVAASLLEVSRFLRDPRHTVRGEREHRKSVIDALKERGIDYVNNDNFNEFTDFMNSLRDQYSEKIFDSSDALEVFGNMARLGVDKDTVMEHYEFFAQNSDKLNRLRIPKTDKGRTYSEMRRKIRRLS